MRPEPSKTGYFILEGLNSFATAYFFNYLLFLFRNRYGFSNLDNLAVAAVHGLVYIPASLFGGRFGQRHGNFPALRIGFGGMTLGIAIGWFIPATWGQFVPLGSGRSACVLPGPCWRRWSAKVNLRTASEPRRPL